MKNVKRVLAVLIAATLISNAHAASEQEELLKLKNTTINLIEALVKEGILSRERADTLMKQAELSAVEETRRIERMEAQQPKKVIRVPYVPEFVKDEIRQQVKDELRAEVVGDVIGHAKQERWGVPDAMPEWTQRIKVKGDFRLRSQTDIFADDNTAGSHFDWQQINNSGGVVAAGQDAFLNTTRERQRVRARFRLGIDAEVTSNLKFSARLSTGNTHDPVTTNQTLGNSNNKYGIVLDRAYLKYDYYNQDGNPSMTFWGGRIPNPWLSTDLVWDSDLGFEGIAATYRHSLTPSDDLSDMDESLRNMFVTVGAFPLQEEERFSDKWLFAGQLGLDMKSENQSRFQLGLAYYNYQNIFAQQNAFGQRTNDWTAPDFIQKGNSLTRISNDVGETSGNPRRVGLASDFKIVNLTASYDFAGFAPNHVIMTMDYAKNIGFDQNEILTRTGTSLDERNEAYGVALTVGSPKVTKGHEWQMSIVWKHVERDAVLDAFTDSDFHLGGTNAEGYVLSGKYGLTENTSLGISWISADEINGPPLGIDVLQIDLNSKF